MLRSLHGLLPYFLVLASSSFIYVALADLIGQEITAVVNPAANGTPTAVLVKVILADGSEIMSREAGTNPLN